MGRSDGVNQESTAMPTWVFWAAILLVGALLRFLELAAAPLSPAEVTEALAALSGLADVEPAGPATSAFLLGMSRLFFWLFGASDVTARLLPALAGSLLPLTALLYGQYLGRRGTLVAASLLAISPSVVFFSRTTSGLLPGVLAALLLFGALLRLMERDDADPRWLVLAGAALGVGLTSGAAFFSLALVMILATFAVRSAGLDELWRNLGNWQPWLVAMGLGVLGCTTFFMFPDGLGSVGSGLEHWINGFGFSRLAFSRPVTILVAYEPLLLFLGVLGSMWAWWRGESFHKALSVWVLFGLLFSLLRPRQADAPFLMLLPLALLAAAFLDKTLLESLEDRERRPALYGGAAVIGILAVHVLVSLGQYAYLDSINSNDANTSLLLVGVSLIVIVGVVSLLWTYSQKLATNSLFLGMMVVLVILSLGKAWELGHTHQNDPRELWVEEGSAPSVHILVETLETASQRNARALHTLPVTVQYDDPILRWYLRDFDNLTWVSNLQSSVISEAVITPVEAEYPLLGDSYLGMDLPLRWQDPSQPELNLLSSTFRWWLHRQGPSPQATNQVVLWLRQDVALVANP